MVAEDRILQRAAARAAEDPFFLAHDLQEYRNMTQTDEAGLARLLHCSRDALVHVGLCRRPDPNGDSFRAEVEKIASHCGVSAQQLAGLIREVDAVLGMREASIPSMQSAQEYSSHLMAARDRKRKSPRGRSGKKRKRQ